MRAAGLAWGGNAAAWRKRKSRSDRSFVDSPSVLRACPSLAHKTMHKALICTSSVSLPMICGCCGRVSPRQHTGKRGASFQRLETSSQPEVTLPTHPINPTRAQVQQCTGREGVLSFVLCLGCPWWVSARQSNLRSSSKRRTFSLLPHSHPFETFHQGESLII